MVVEQIAEAPLTPTLLDAIPFAGTGGGGIHFAFLSDFGMNKEVLEEDVNNFNNKTKVNKLIKGFGGIDKYH